MVFLVIRGAQLAYTNRRFKTSNGARFLTIFKCGLRFLVAVFGFWPILDAVFGFWPFLYSVCGFLNPYNPPWNCDAQLFNFVIEVSRYPNEYVALVFCDY